MTIPLELERAAPDERARSAAVEFYLAYERIVIGGTTLLVFLLAWEAFARSGLVDPLFISSPTRVAQAGWELVHDSDFWRDLTVSGNEFLLGYGAAVAVRIPPGLAIGPSPPLQSLPSPSPPP